jgi:hypothetical protein
MRNLWISLGLLAVLATSACAAVEAPAAVPTTSPPSAEPTAEPETGAIERVFDGDCSRLVAADLVSADVGATLTLAAEPWVAELAYASIPQLGGMYCVWRGPAEDDPSLSVVALPSRALTVPRPVGTECSEGAFCSFGAIASGFQFFGSMHVAGGEVAAVQASADALTVRIASSLASAAQPAPYAPDGPWDAAIDCTGLDAGRSIPTTLGDPAIESYPYGGDAEPNYGFYAAYEAAGPTHCEWAQAQDGSGARVSVDLMPGGAWRRADIEALGDSTVVSIPGFEHALVRGDTLHGFTAVNRLDLTLDAAGTALALTDFYPAATALAAELDAR